MPQDLVIPSLGESVTEAVLLRWLKNDGDPVAKDENVAELETDKANVELPATAAGVLRGMKQPGQSYKVGEAIARIDEGGAGDTSGGTAGSAGGTATAAAGGGSGGGSGGGTTGGGAVTGAATSAGGSQASSQRPGGAGSARRGSGNGPATAAPTAPAGEGPRPEDLSPAVRRLVDENELDPASIPATGPNGRLTKEDVERHLQSRGAAGGPAGAPPERTAGARPTPPAPAAEKAPAPAPAAAPGEFNAEGVKRVPMSKIRKRIAQNLVQAQQTAAILTTFNEVDLSSLMDLRARYKEKFEKAHGVGLGLMSFFSRAVVLALREFPRVNAQLDGDDIVYFDHVHLGIAVSTERGLMVPVLRHVEGMSFAKIESEIKRLAGAARDGKVGIHELSGGTFSITNGGVFGSLLSTPIISPPQSAILGMHTIQKRPVAVGDKVEIRPMMYLALSYDHRLVDGRESVSFLVRVKEYLEDPARLMLEV